MGPTNSILLVSLQISHQFFLKRQVRRLLMETLTITWIMVLAHIQTHKRETHGGLWTWNLLLPYSRWILPIVVTVVVSERMKI